MAIIFLLLAVVCAVFLVYPYTIYPVILKATRSKPLQVSEVEPSINFTLVFCAFNEAAAIDEKIANIKDLKKRYPSLEVLAFDDGSTDGTFDKLSASDSPVTTVRGGGRNGKAHGMKILAARAKGDVIVFTDANVILDLDALSNLAKYFSDPDVGGVCGKLVYKGDGDSVTANVGGAYWRLEEMVKSEESRTGNVMGADGSIFSLRRELYPEFPDSVLDDLTVSMAAVFAGRRLIKADDVVAYERLVTRRGEEFARKVRIASRAFHTHKYLVPQLKSMKAEDKFKYISRKYIRWFGASFLAIGAVSGLVAFYLIHPVLGAIATVVGIAVLFLGLRAQRGPLATVFEIGTALFATQLGVIRAARGAVVTVWSPAASR